MAGEQSGKIRKRFAAIGSAGPEAGPWTSSCPVQACFWQRRQLVGPGPWVELGSFPGQLSVLLPQKTRPIRKSVLESQHLMSLPARLLRPVPQDRSQPEGTRDSGPSGETEAGCKAMQIGGGTLSRAWVGGVSSLFPPLLTARTAGDLTCGGPGHGLSAPTQRHPTSPYPEVGLTLDTLS